MLRIHHYGHRDRAERTPGSHDAFIAGCAIAILGAGCGLVVVAGLLDGLIFAGRVPPLRHRPLPQIVARVFTHPSHPYRAFAPGTVGLAASPGAYWTIFGLLTLILMALTLWVAVRFGRWGSKTHAGFASSATVRRVASARAVAAKRAQTRPDLAGQRHQAAHQFGYPLGRAITSGAVAMRGSWESSLVTLGPPGSGKTLRLLVPILKDHPGPAVVTSTKVDIFEATAVARAAIGPVAVLDPEAMAPAGAPVRWSVVRGCEDTRTAERRAAALIAGAPGGTTLDTGNSAFFKASALSVLKTFLHAAALGGKTIVDVQRWCRGDYSGAEAILTGRADPLVDPAGQLTQHTVGAEETTSGVMRYVENTLACFSHRSVIDLCTPKPNDEFDMRAFAEANGTVYLLGKGERQSSASALTTAFTEELLFLAGDIMAPTRPGRRLSPPLLACLDEAPSVAPIPSLPLHLADARGRGMVIIVSAQSPSQLRTKWSVAEAETMFNAATIKVVFGGLSVDNDLEWLARLTGRRYVLNHTRQTRPDWRTDYSSHWEEVSVLRADEIRTLSPGHALVMISATAPVIADLPLAFQRRGGRQLLADMQAMAARNDRARLPAVPV
jgi:hypothetical protein